MQTQVLYIREYKPTPWITQKDNCANIKKVVCSEQKPGCKDSSQPGPRSPRSDQHLLMSP